ncbi:MAG: hypothetical protein KJT03_19465, partial [Verrucomicrobiae bacterium]|nr:hypothetical protein [Verrucomicrobiae bacterium]
MKLQNSHATRRQSVKYPTWLALISVLGPFTEVSAQEAANDEVYEISPFVITEEEDTGYIATQTLAGTRLRSSLQDIGASVQVITTEFLSDIGATESNDLLLFTTATETFGLGGNFSGGDSRQDDRVLTGAALNNPQSTNRVRGLGSPDNTRDFFITDIPFDSYNTGRVEINRGANAILFGLGSPSGVLNAGLNKAVFDEINEVDFRVQDGGDQLSTRGSVDFNRVLIEDRLAVRVSAMQADRNYSQKPTFQDQERYYITATYAPFQSTTIRANYENGHIRSNTPDPVGPLQAIDEYLRQRDIYHAALRADTTPVDQSDELPFIYDPWLFANRAMVGTPPALYGTPDTGVDNYANILGNQGLGQSLAMVWGSATPDPDFGFPGVIPAGILLDTDPNQAGFQVPPFYDGQRLGTNQAPRQPRVSRFWRVDNAGARNGVYEGFTDLELFNFADQLLSGPVAFQNRDFDAFQASLEQTFWDNKAGFELAFAQQHFKRNNFNGFPGRTMGIMVDIAPTLTTGQ